MSGTELSRVRTELHPLGILPTVPPHPVQPHSESPGHGHLGDVRLPPHCQVHVPSLPLRVTTRCRLSCFEQQETPQRAALLVNAPQLLMPRAGIFCRNQSDIAADLLAAPKPLRSSDDENEGQRRDRPYAGMTHQPRGFTPSPGF